MSPGMIGQVIRAHSGPLCMVRSLSRACRAGVLISLITVVSACGNSKASTPAAARSTQQSVTVAMGYIPNVQFAPFYVAASRGYYRREGLDVHFRYGIEPDLLHLLAQGKVDFVNSGGDEVLIAAAQGIPVRYVMTEYARFPAAIFSLRSTGISSAKNLRGHSIGVPGKYGSSYVGLLALLQRAGIAQSDVSIQSIGFSQVQSVLGHKVDAAMGYATNEPLQLRNLGKAVNEIDVYHFANLAGAGIAASNDTITHRPSLVRAFVVATLHGLRDTLKQPDVAFALTLKAVPGMARDRTVQRAILQRSLDFWRPEKGHALGWSDPAVWSETGQLLYRFKQIRHPVTGQMFMTNRFVPAR